MPDAAVVVPSMLHCPDCSSPALICLICGSDCLFHLGCELKALKRLDGSCLFILKRRSAHCKNVFKACPTGFNVEAFDLLFSSFD